MMHLNRILLVKMHMMLAAFILPVAIMFFMTGALYTWGVKGGYDVESYPLVLKQPFTNNKEWLTKLVIHELTSRELAAPSGKVKIKQVGTSFYLEWTGSRLDVSLAPTANPFVAQLKIKKTSWHRLFVQLHKAKGGIAFKVYAAFLAAGLVFLFLSGVLMAWQVVKYRTLLLSSASAGILLFIVMIGVG